MADTTREFMIEYSVHKEYLTPFAAKLGYPVIVRARCAGWLKEDKPVVVTSNIEMAGNVLSHIANPEAVHNAILVAAMHTYKDQIYGVPFELSPVTHQHSPKMAEA